MKNIKVKKKIEAGIYAISFDGYDKAYIGSSIDLEKRYKVHLYELKTSRHVNPHLQNIYNKGYKINFRVLAYCDPDEKYIRLLEQKIIDGYDWNDLINISKITSVPPRGHKKGMQSKKMIVKIFNLVCQGLRIKQISKIFKIEKSVLHSIISRKTYKDIDIPKDIIDLAQLNMSNKFTEEEIKFIKDNRCVISFKKIGLHLGRNTNSVRNFCNNIGLKCDKVAIWTEQEDKFLIDNYQKLGRKACAELIGRTKASLSNRVNYLKRIGIDIRERKTEGTPSFWDESKIQFIKKNAHKGSKFLGEYFNRKPSQIAGVCTINKIVLKNNKWSIEDIKYLMDNYVEFGVKYCSEQLKRSARSITSKYNLEVKNGKR